MFQIDSASPLARAPIPARRGPNCMRTCVFVQMLLWRIRLLHQQDVWIVLGDDLLPMHASFATKPQVVGSDLHGVRSLHEGGTTLDGSSHQRRLTAYNVTTFRRQHHRARNDMTTNFNRSAALAYGLVSYAIGVVGLACIVLSLARWIPFGFLHAGQYSRPVLWDLMLVALWGLSHSGMARSGFKRWITRFIPEPTERSTYVLVSGVVSVLLVGLWREVPGVVWSVQNQVAIALLWGLFWFGWVYLLAATFAINHFDLFGLRQVFLHFRQQPRAQLKFVKTAMYRFTRHPIQTGVLIGIWATPEMTATQLVLSIGFTAYIFVGLWFEERDLVRVIGEPYLQYRREAGLVLPKLFRRN